MGKSAENYGKDPNWTQIGPKSHCVKRGPILAGGGGYWQGKRGYKLGAGCEEPKAQIIRAKRGNFGLCFFYLHTTSFSGTRNGDSRLKRDHAI